MIDDVPEQVGAKNPTDEGQTILTLLLVLHPRGGDFLEGAVADPVHQPAIGDARANRRQKPSPDFGLVVALAQDVLRNILDRDDPKVTIEIIQKYVANFYSLKLSDLKSRNNARSVSQPRQIAMYICKSLTNASLPQIGKSFGGKHHSTVIHSIRKVEGNRKKDPAFNSLIENFLKSFT